MTSAVVTRKYRDGDGSLYPSKGMGIDEASPKATKTKDPNRTMELLVFPTERVMKRRELDMDKVRDWATVERTPLELSDALSEESLFQTGVLNLYRSKCQNIDREFPIFMSSRDEDGELETLDEDLDNDLFKKVCDHVKKSDRAYGEVFSRDMDILHVSPKQDVTVKTYAIVLISNKEYHGHVYVWSNGSDMYVMGIRNRVDEFLRVQLYGNDYPYFAVRGVSYKLFHGAAVMAKRLKLKRIIVTYPQGAMKSILPDKMGFKKLSGIPLSNLKGSLASGIQRYGATCNDCWYAEVDQFKSREEIPVHITV